MKRKWIVRVQLANEEVVVDSDVAPAFRGAVEELRSRVSGELAFALVPNGKLSEVWKKLDPKLPLHLVIPSETVPAENSFEGDWEFLSENAASTNIQPGRGRTKSDWKDCDAWLDSIAEIDLLLGDSAETISIGEEPTLFFRLDGTAEFANFEENTPLSDAVFEQVADDVFGKIERSSDIEAISHRADAVAGRCAPWFRFLESGSLFLNISPGIILAVGGLLLWMPETKALWKFAAAFLATLAALGLKKVRSRRCWLSARALAEICRSIRHSGDILDPLFPPATDHLPSHAPIVRSVAIAHAEEILETGDETSAIRDRYLNQRLAGQEGQIDYYSRQAKKARWRRKWVKGVFQIATILALVSTGVAVASLSGLLPGSEAFTARWVTGVATFAFPALAAAAIGYLGISETTRRADYYAEMVRLLEQQRDILETLQSRSSIKEAIRKTESLLLEEFSGWLRRRVY